MKPFGTVDLYWIPLGAGDHVVKFSGRGYERMVAFTRRRTPCDLYHSALIVTFCDGPRIIEQAPVADLNGRTERGVDSERAVGLRIAARFRLFRYENLCWLNGIIPGIRSAVSSPVRISDNPVHAERIVDLLPAAPQYVWGRDVLGAGEMWNSNSLIAWVLTHSQIFIDDFVLHVEVERQDGGQESSRRIEIVDFKQYMCSNSLVSEARRDRSATSHWRLSA